MGVDSKGPCHRKQDRKGRVGTHLCGRSQPCETDAAQGHLSEQGLLGTGARAPPQEASTKTVVESREDAEEQRRGLSTANSGRMENASNKRILVKVQNGGI